LEETHLKDLEAEATITLRWILVSFVVRIKG